MKRRIKYKRLADWSSSSCRRITKLGGKKSFRFKIKLNPSYDTDNHEIEDQYGRKETIKRRDRKRLISKSFILVNYNVIPLLTYLLLLTYCCYCCSFTLLNAVSAIELPNNHSTNIQFRSLEHKISGGQLIDDASYTSSIHDDSMESSESRVIASLSNEKSHSNNANNKPTDAIRSLLMRPRFSLVSFVPNLLSKQMILKRPEMASNLQRLRKKLHQTQLNGGTSYLSHMTQNQDRPSKSSIQQQMRALTNADRNHNHLGYRLPIFLPPPHLQQQDFIASMPNVQQGPMTASFVPTSGQNGAPPVLVSLETRGPRVQQSIPLHHNLQHQHNGILVVHEEPLKLQQPQLEETERHLGQIDQEIKSEFESRFNLHDHIVANESSNYEDPAPMGVFVAPPRLVTHESLTGSLERPTSETTTIEPVVKNQVYDDDNDNVDDNRDDYGNRNEKNNHDTERDHQRHEQIRDGGGEQMTMASLIQANEDSDWQPTDYPSIRGFTGGRGQGDESERFSTFIGSDKSSHGKLNGLKPKKHNLQIVRPVMSSNEEDKNSRILSGQQKQHRQENQQVVPFVPTPEETIAQLKLNGSSNGKVVNFLRDSRKQPFDSQQSSEVVISSSVVTSPIDIGSDKLISTASRQQELRNLIQNQDPTSKLLLPSNGHQTPLAVLTGDGDATSTSDPFGASRLASANSNAGSFSSGTIDQDERQPSIAQVSAEGAKQQSTSRDATSAKTELIASDSGKGYDGGDNNGNFHPTTGSLSEILRKLRETRARIKQLQEELNGTTTTQATSSASSSLPFQMAPWKTSQARGSVPFNLAAESGGLLKTIQPMGVEEARDVALESEEEQDKLKLPVKRRKEAEVATGVSGHGQRGIDWFKSWAPPPLGSEQSIKQQQQHSIATTKTFTETQQVRQQVRGQQTMGMPMGMYHSGPLTSPARLVASAFGRAAHNALGSANHQTKGGNKLPVNQNHQHEHQVVIEGNAIWQHPSPAPILLSSTITVASPDDDQQVDSGKVTTVSPIQEQQRHFRRRPSANSTVGSSESVSIGNVQQQVVAHSHPHQNVPQNNQNQQAYFTSKWNSSHKHQRGDERFRAKLASPLAVGGLGNINANTDTNAMAPSDGRGDSGNNNSFRNLVTRTKYVSDSTTGVTSMIPMTTTPRPQAVAAMATARPPPARQQVVETLSTGDGYGEENNSGNKNDGDEEESGKRDEGESDLSLNSNRNLNRKLEHQKRQQVITSGAVQSGGAGKVLKSYGSNETDAGNIPSGGHYVKMTGTLSVANSTLGKLPERVKSSGGNSSNNKTQIETSTSLNPATSRNDGGNFMSQLFYKLLDSIYSVSASNTPKSASAGQQVSDSGSGQRVAHQPPSSISSSGGGDVSYKLTTERVLQTVIVFSCLFALICVIVVYTSFRCQRLRSTSRGSGANGSSCNAGRSQLLAFNPRGRPVSDHHAYPQPQPQQVHQIHMNPHHNHHHLRLLGSRKYCSSNSSGALIGALATNAPPSHSSSCDRLILDGTMRNVSLLARHLHQSPAGLSSSNNNNNQIYTSPSNKRRDSDCCHCFTCSAGRNNSSNLINNQSVNDFYASPQRKLPFGAASSVNKIHNQESQHHHNHSNSQRSQQQQQQPHGGNLVTNGQPLLQRVPIGGTRLRMMSSTEDAMKLSPRFCYGTESDEDEEQRDPSTTTCCQCSRLAHGQCEASGSATITKKQRAQLNAAAASGISLGLGESGALGKTSNENQEYDRNRGIKTKMASNDGKHQRVVVTNDQGAASTDDANTCECNECHPNCCIMNPAAALLSNDHSHNSRCGDGANGNDDSDDVECNISELNNRKGKRELVSSGGGLKQSINATAKSAKQQKQPQEHHQKHRAKSSTTPKNAITTSVMTIAKEEATTLTRDESENDRKKRQHNLKCITGGGRSNLAQSPVATACTTSSVDGNALSHSNCNNCPLYESTTSGCCNQIKRSPNGSQSTKSAKFKAWTSSPLLLVAGIRKGLHKKIIGGNDINR